MTARDRTLSAAVAHLSPGYFALVMATGIVSIALRDAGAGLPAPAAALAAGLSAALLSIAIAAYLVLWVLFAWRAIAFPHHLRADLRSPEQAFGFFTVVAGTDVLAVRLAQAGAVPAAIGFVIVAVALWCVFGYLLPWQVLVARDREERILSRTNGSWFVWAVASQSLAVASAEIQPHAGEAAEPWLGMLAVMSWSVGVALYAGVAMLVLLRIVHYGIAPEEFTPPYWVAMGALAIAVVAGSGIVGMASTPMVDAARGLIAALVVVFWCFCAWLTPLLVGAGFWRHAVHRIPLDYEPGLWSMVFPVGMIAVASMSMGRADDLAVVHEIGRAIAVASVLVWAVVFAGLVRRIARVLAASSRARRIAA